MGVRAKKRQRKPRMKISQIEDALRACGGVYSTAAGMLGCAPNTVKNYVLRSPRLQKAEEEIIERNVDLAEAGMLAVLRNPKHPKYIAVCMFMLKTKGHQRGYVEKQEVEAKLGGSVSFYKLNLPEEKDSDD